MNKIAHAGQYDVAILGGGLIGAVVALTLRQRGMRVVVLESRTPGKEQKIVVGEAVTEGTSLYLRHELGLEGWLTANGYRKFGFDFVTLPDGEPPRTIEECHELLLSQAPLEKIAKAYSQLIPTYHVERPALNDHVGELARAAGATWMFGASVEHVELGEGQAPHVVRYAVDGKTAEVSARWIADCSGRKCILGRQLGIHRPVTEPSTAAVWNRFEHVESDRDLWSSYHGIDRRRHTIHFTGKGFWIWWIHQSSTCTSVGITWDKAQHKPDVKTADHGFREMVGKFPLVLDLLRDAVAKEPYQYLAHLAYRSDYWIHENRYALMGDAAWFTDALYSVGLETATRQTVLLTRAISDDLSGNAAPASFYEQLNHQYGITCRAVAHLNAWKYKHGWHDPYRIAQTVLYETAEIGPLYELQKKSDWTYERQRKFYGLQWGSEERMARLEQFLDETMQDNGHHEGLLRKALVPGRVVYGATWPLWNVPGWTHYFFRLIRAWGYAERLAQRKPYMPDFLKRMAHGFIPGVAALKRIARGEPATSRADARTGT